MNARFCTLALVPFFLALTNTFLQAQKAIRLSNRVNSSYEEREPIPSPDGKTLYFWRRTAPGNVGGEDDPGDIWVSTLLAPGIYNDALHPGMPLNTRGHDFVWQVSPRGDTLWLNQSPLGRTSAGISYTTKDYQGFWRTPTEVYIHQFDYRGSFKDYFLTPQRIMLIPNEGEDTYGGTDIYICFPINDTAWSKPVNMGPVINSFGDDDAPYLAKDGKTLYFNSNGHGGYGEHDVFYSTRLDDTWLNWSEPVNLGYPVNTPGYDFDFVLTADEKHAYWGSDQTPGGDNDIFRQDFDRCELDVYPKGNFTLCTGEEILLEAGFVHTTEVVHYQWFKDGKPIADANARQYLVNRPGRYQVKRSYGDCERESAPQQVNFRPGPEARVISSSQMICPGDSTELSVIVRGGEYLGLQWQRNGLDIPGATRKIYWAQTTGEYRVKIYNENCNSFTEIVQLQRMEAPSIFIVKDTLPNSRLRIPQWTWSNRLPEQKGEGLPQDMATDQQNNSLILSLEKTKKGYYREYLTKVYQGGPVSYSQLLSKKTDLSPRYMHVDSEDNIVITRTDKYLAKYRADGKLLWEIPEQREWVNGITTDPAGYIYTMGRFRDTLRIGDQKIKPTKRGNLYLAKHDPNGNLVWVKNYSVDWYTHDFGNALHSDCDGNLYLSGGFKSIANFRDRILRTPLRIDSYFLVKLNPDGAFRWARKISTDKINFQTHDVHTDCFGNTYLLVNYKLVKYDANGQLLYEGSLRAPGVPHRVRIAGNGRNELFIAGTTLEKAEFFVTKLDLQEQQVLLWNGRGTETEEGYLPIIHADDAGSIYVAGSSKREMPPGLALAPLKASPIFFARYGRPIPQKKRKPISLCESESGSIELLVRASDGIRYQWFKDEQPIPGANRASIIVSEAGDYQVQAISPFCDRLSPIQSVSACGEPEELAPETPPIASTTPVMPEKQARSPMMRPLNKLPKTLKGRKVKKQGDVKVASRNITLSVYDHGAFDKDTISLNVNGNWVLQNYCLRKKPKTLTIELDPGQANYIILYAHNLGSLPPNTASLVISDGITRKRHKLESDMKSCGTINLVLE